MPLFYSMTSQNRSLVPFFLWQGCKKLQSQIAHVRAFSQKLQIPVANQLHVSLGQGIKLSCFIRNLSIKHYQMQCTPFV